MSFKSCLSEHFNTTIPECAVCGEQYDELERVAKILNCGHTICEVCVNKLEAEYNCQTDGYRDFAYTILKCPFCQLLNQIPRDFLRTNDELMVLVQKSRNPIGWDNISYSYCNQCRGLFHENDLKICVVCTIPKEDLLASEVPIDGIAECSTCLMRNHVVLEDSFITLQFARLRKQLEENERELGRLHEKMHKAQNWLISQIDQTKSIFSEWNVAHEMRLTRFRNATNSLDQQNAFRDVANRMNRAISSIGKMNEFTDTWFRGIRADSTVPKTYQVSRVEVSPQSVQPGDGSQYRYYFEL